MNAPMSNRLLASQFSGSFIAACDLDVLAFKPGNVSVESPGHGMTAEDFMVSARAAAPHATDSSLCLGERIYRAIESTRDAVGCNTNLGIVLLAVPLIHAAENPSSGKSLVWRLRHTLLMLTREDASWVYRAIRLAAPGGLGESRHHDVKEEPTITLFDAMREAAERDRIAYQYVNSYADIFATGLTSLHRGRACWGSEEAAIATSYLEFLASFPDSHIWRKHGLKAAKHVQKMARDCVALLHGCKDWQSAKTHLKGLDQALKFEDFNPGTSADLSVATWLADRLGREEEDCLLNLSRRDA